MRKLNILLSIGILISHASRAQSCLSSATNYSVGINPEGITCADFNGDNKKDVVTVSWSNNNDASILLGNGLGAFSTGTPFILSGYSVASADFNNDGKMDLVSVEGYGATISLGNGLGGFSQSTYRAIGSNNSLKSVISEDFNGDGKMDIAACNGNPSTVLILFGNGFGNVFPVTATSFSVGTNPYCIISDDFNGDGKIDLATANQGSNNVSVLLGNGAGGFSPATNFSVAANPRTITSGDFNSDGKIDIVTANSSPSNNISIITGDGAGGFSTPSNFPSYPATAITKADFNGDAKLDVVIAVAGASVSVIHGNGLGGFSAPNSVTVGSAPSCVVSADFNSDGKPDIATSNRNSNNASILLGLFSITTSQTNVTCNGGNNGTATAIATCGTASSYLWNTIPAQTTATANGLISGTYQVTVTDVNGAVKTATVVITQPSLLSASILTTPNKKCSGFCNGTASVSGITGGPSPYTYQWSGSANSQTTAIATSLCEGYYSVLIKDANNCSILKYTDINSSTVADPNIYLTNLAAIDQINVSPSFAAYYSYNLPPSITPSPSNPRNFVDPGKKARFKVECKNQKSNGQSIVSGICKVRTNNPYVTVTDSSSALNNVGWSNAKWSVDEFEIDIDPNTPAGTNAYIDFVVQESGVDFKTTCIAIPIRPLVYAPTSPFTIDDDNNPDSQGNDNDVCEPNETIEFYPWLDNISTLDAEYVRGKFENLDNHSFINIWNGVSGVGTTVYDATWWNYSFAQPQTINPFSTNTTPEYDFVFDYNNATLINNFKLYMVMAGGFNLFSGNALSLVQWTLPYTFNDNGAISVKELDATTLNIKPVPNPSSGIFKIINCTSNNTSIKVLNSQGQVVLESDKFIHEIDLSNQPKGIYFLQFKSEDKIINKKIIIQ